ncbi:putative Hemicentin-1 [Hypsibius exemplaris]|uniref:Hemicentin-1 n=1 Tax=Hypsibius exemplaris TaxID=2072580 RepID=A0A1W0WCU6_HYPEX|nr:putative Hemicentin-1 [Hypsibius exemplaris]
MSHGGRHTVLARLWLTMITFSLTATSTKEPSSDIDADPPRWTNWDDWSPCDVTCGVGIQVKHRACYPIGAECMGSSRETQRCNLTACPDVGKWSEWTQWSDCTKSCGIGTQTKYRTCLSAEAQQQCLGSNRNVRVCNTDPCKTSGGWSAWNEWSPCSEPCGRGVRYQDRTCEDPAPTGGGAACSGPGTKVGFCFEKPCTDKAASQVSVFDGEAYVEYEKTFVSRKLLSVYVKFKPEERDGLLVYRHHGVNHTSAGSNDTVVLRLEGGHVELFVQMAGVVASLRHDEILEMSRWSNVFAAVVGTRIILRVNNGVPMERKSPNVEMEKVDLDQQMFVGGVSEMFRAAIGITHPGFVGWIASVRVGYEEYFLDETEEMTSVNEQTNHPIAKRKVVRWDVEAEELYPMFTGDDYTVFTCSDCHKPDIVIEIVIKPFSTSTGVVWSNFGEEAGSYLILKNIGLLSRSR